eukprot:1966694-Amphidinium_carterae.1
MSTEQNGSTLNDDQKRKELTNALGHRPHRPTQQVATDRVGMVSVSEFQSSCGSRMESWLAFKHVEIGGQQREDGHQWHPSAA